mgnify:CR=1 FL=1
MKKVVNKGYTLTVVAWENDADNYNTKSKTVATKEEAKVWFDMMQLCESENNQPKGVIKLGNSSDLSPEQEEIAKNFIKQHHQILVPQDNIEENEDNLVDWFCSLAGGLLGHSEWYTCRVMASVTITYSPEDVFVEEVNF